MNKKPILIFIALMLFFTASCKKKNRSVNQKLSTTSRENPAVQALDSHSVTYYTQFGKFITSITPDSFFGKFYHIKYFDALLSSGNTIALLGPEANTPSEGVTVDFYRDSTLILNPKLTGNVYTNADGTGSFYKETDVTLDLLFVQMGFKLEIKLPSAYNGIELNQFRNFTDYGKQLGNVIKTNQFPLNQPVQALKMFNVGDMYFYFGRTDSTFIETGSGPQPNFGPNNSIHVRSSRYSPWILEEPLPGETHTVISTIGFNFDKIIHVYAGADNVPFTIDDIVVFEPGFWERIFADINIIKE